jgi:co-chaperonin GroES (HSP10)
MTVITPTGQNILIKLTPKQETTSGGVFLTEQRIRREQSGHILALGSRVKNTDLVIGQKVYFQLGEFKIIDNSEETAIVAEDSLIGYDEI